MESGHSDDCGLKKNEEHGFIILLSTPFGKGGYFYDAFSDPDFKHIHISSEDCKRIPKDFLAKEKQRLTKAEYMQEYLGEFTTSGINSSRRH